MGNANWREKPIPVISSATDLTKPGGKGGADFIAALAARLFVRIPARLPSAPTLSHHFR